MSNPAYDGAGQRTPRRRARTKGTPVRIDFLGMQAFAAIAERGSFRLAAGHLNLSQTALSHRVRKLEADMGLKLFLRSSQGVSLTPAGANLFKRVKGSIEDMQDAVETVRNSADEKTREVFIGCLTSIAPTLCRNVLEDFHARHPDVYIRVCDNNVQELDSLVKSGAIDFALTLAMAYRSDFEVNIVGRDHFALICPEDTDLPEGTVGWDAIQELPMIRISNKSDNRKIIDDALGGRRDSINWRYEVRRVSTAISMVESGLACAAVPLIALNSIAPRSRFRVMQLRNPSVSRQLCTISRLGEPMSPLVDELHRMTIRALSEQLTVLARTQFTH